jgi:hypothetical protein
MSIEKSIEITIEVTEEEVQALLDLSLVTSTAASVIERISEEYCLHVEEAQACNEQWRKTDGE